MNQPPDILIATALEISDLGVSNILCKNNSPTLI